jgi:hypothetical protein
VLELWWVGTLGKVFLAAFLAVIHIWDEEYILSLIRGLPADDSSADLWKELAIAASLEDLVSRLGLSKEELLAASTKLEARREEALRRHRAIKVCGEDFDRSDENLSGLWHHICSRLPSA